MPGNYPTADDFREASRGALTAPGSPLSSDVVNIPSSNAGIVVEATATMGGIVSRQVVDGLKGLTLGSARGQALDLLVLDRYDMTRNGAAPGVGEVGLSRPTATYGAISVPSGTQISAGSVMVETTEPAAFGPADLGPYTVNVQTTRGGLDQAVAAGTNLAVQGLADTSIVATIAADLAGMADEESDTDLVARAVAFWPNARRGTVPAILNGLLATPGVYRAVADEVLDADGVQVGYVEAWISDKAGRSNSTLASLALAGLEEYRAAGCLVVINTTVPLYATISIVGITFTAGTDTSAKRDAIKAAILARVNELGPGQPLLLGSIYAVLDGIASITVPAGSITEPVGDLTAGAGETIRTRLDLITVNGA